MKLTLTIELKVPDEIGDNQAEIDQRIFDSVVNYATCAHLRDAITWCGKAKVDTPEVDQTGKRIMDHHNLWADILGNAEWRVEIKEDEHNDQQE